MPEKSGDDARAANGSGRGGVDGPESDRDERAAPIGEDGAEPPWDERMAPGSGDDGVQGGGDAAGDARPERDDAGDSDGEGAAGEFAPSGPVEPGTPKLENAVFVVVGAYLAILAMGDVVLGVGGMGLRSLAAITGVALLVTLISFGFFGLLNPDT